MTKPGNGAVAMQEDQPGPYLTQRQLPRGYRLIRNPSGAHLALYTAIRHTRDQRRRQEFAAVAEDFVRHLDPDTGLIRAGYSTIAARSGLTTAAVSRFVRWGRRNNVVGKVRRRRGQSGYYVVLGEEAPV